MNYFQFTTNKHLKFFLIFSLVASIISIAGAASAAAQSTGPTCRGEVATIVGTVGNDRINGTEGIDVIVGLRGNDTIYGLGGDDIICGGKGHDQIFGGAGNDIIAGSTGNDKLNGNAGNDTIYGSQGSDTIFGGNGWDTIRGGNGHDVIRGGKGRDNLYGNAGDDTLNGNAGIDFLNGNRGVDIVRGGNHNDVLVGGIGRDTLDGGNGNDLIWSVSNGNTTPLIKDNVIPSNGSDIFDGGDDSASTQSAAPSTECTQASLSNPNNPIYASDNANLWSSEGFTALINQVRAICGQNPITDQQTVIRNSGSATGGNTFNYASEMIQHLNTCVSTHGENACVPTSSNNFNPARINDWFRHSTSSDSNYFGDFTHLNMGWAGENVLYTTDGFNSTQGDHLRSWIASSGHFCNLINPRFDQSSFTIGWDDPYDNIHAASLWLRGDGDISGAAPSPTVTPFNVNGVTRTTCNW